MKIPDKEKTKKINQNLKMIQMMINPMKNPQIKIGKKEEKKSTNETDYEYSDKDMGEMPKKLQKKI